ncbi:unnamed protein product, partial [Musa hybrid cultivar]
MKVRVISAAEICGLGPCYMRQQQRLGLIFPAIAMFPYFFVSKQIRL